MSKEAAKRGKKKAGEKVAEETKNVVKEKGKRLLARD